jgi:prevent-host-death family protein
LIVTAKRDDNGHMTKVGVARLKAQFRRYLAVARRGHEVVVTARGRPIAKLVALADAGRANSRVERLIRAGVVISGAGRLRPSLRKPPRGPRLGDAVLRALLEEREKSR